MRRSSTASKLKPRSLATDATVSRASRTWLGVAGRARRTSSPCPSRSAPLPRGWWAAPPCSLIRALRADAPDLPRVLVLDGHHLRESGQLEHLARRARRCPQHQVAAALPQTLERTDQDAEAG